MIVGTHLNGPVTGIGNADNRGRGTRIQFNVAISGDDFSWYHLLFPSKQGLTDRVVNGHQLCSIGKSRFDLNVVNHVSDPLHHLVS